MNSKKNRTTQLSHSVLPPDAFLTRLCDTNKLSALQYWLFDNGMHFLDSCQWWNNKKRSRFHEGLDLVFYMNTLGNTINFTPGTQIPALFDGVAVHHHPDFLGQTLYVRHEAIRQDSRILHSLYAHIDIIPQKLRKITTHSTIALIAGDSVINSVCPHFHISIAWIEEKLNLTAINWQNIVECKSIHFIDPMNYIINSPDIIKGLHCGG